MRYLNQWGVAVLVVALWGALALLGWLLGCSPASEGEKGEPKPTCAAWCSITIGCAGDPDPQCDDACETYSTACPVEMRALIGCHLRLPDSGLWCSADGYTEARASQCADEKLAASECWAGQ